MSNYIIIGASSGIGQQLALNRLIYQPIIKLDHRTNFTC